MTLYGGFKTDKGLGKTPIIDYIMVEFPLGLPERFTEDGSDLVSMSWDESDWDYDSETGKGFFRCKGVTINDVYPEGPGDLAYFAGAILDSIQVYIDEYPNEKLEEFTLTNLVLDEGEVLFQFTDLEPREMYYERDH